MNKRGDKVTIYDVSKRVGMSIATVNRALNGKERVSDKTRELIIQAASEMGFKANKAARALSRNPISIGVILAESIPEFTASVMKGMERAFFELSDFNVQCELRRIEAGDEGARHDAAIRHLRELNAMGCRGVVVLPQTDATGMDAIIAGMRDKGVLTAAVVTAIACREMALTVRSDGVCGGEMAAELLSMMCPNDEVAVFSSSPMVEICRENVRGFKQGLDGRGMRLMHVYENYDDPALARRAVDHLAASYPDVRGLYICSANSTAVCRRIEELGLTGRYRVVASDLFDELSANMDKGLIDATLFQNPQKQGELCVKYLYEMILGERDPGEEIRLVPQIILRSNRDVTLRNMEEMERRWAAKRQASEAEYEE
jgi:LacI family transcriptional regulator